VELEAKLDTLFSFLRERTHEKCIVFLSTIEQVKFIYALSSEMVELDQPKFEFHGKLQY